MLTLILAALDEQASELGAPDFCLSPLIRSPEQGLMFLVLE
jgi:hypothetical protein